MDKKPLNSIKTLLWVSLITSVLFFYLGTNIKTLESYLYTLGISAMYTFGYGLSNGFLNEYLNRTYSWIDDTRKRIISSIVGSVLLNVGLTYLFNYINLVLVQGVSTEKFFSPLYSFINWFLVILALLISAILHARGFMEAWKESSKQQLDEQKHLATAANARFESLKNQLDPHFLFNSLNVLSALIEENPSKAIRFTDSLSKVYRYVLEQKDKKLVPVSEEVDFAKTYMALLKTRFEDNVEFITEVPDGDHHLQVVPLSLQLLLENSIKHNHATKSKPLVVRIYSQGDYLIIENNIQKRAMSVASSGIGLNNIRNRYLLLTDQQMIIEDDEQVFRVKLPMLNPTNTK